MNNNMTIVCLCVFLLHYLRTFGNLAGNSNAKLYSAPGYLPPDTPQTTPCAGNGRVCVPKYQCSNGQIDANQVAGKSSQVNTQLV